MGWKILGLTGLLLLSTSTLAEASYTGAVLYQLTPPSGYSFVAASGTSETAFGGQVVGWGLSTGGSQDPILWTEAGTATDLTPSGVPYSHAYGTDGTQQVGFAYLGVAASYTHAILWSGTAGSAVDLNPDGYLGSSAALGVSGGQQVGFAQPTSTTQDAMLWTGSADTAVDLNPTNLTGFSDTTAFATSGNQQVGNGEIGPVATQTSHALLWSGAADTAVDLNPTDLTGFTDTIAYGTSGSQQVGYGQDGSYNHALLWYGSAESAVDLNPDGFLASEAFGVFGNQQVGEGNGYAMLWSGSADSAVNLQLLLPADGTWTGSVAYSIDGSGNIYGTANGTLNGVTGTYAVEWSVPEPASLSLLALVAPVLVARRRRSAV